MLRRVSNALGSLGLVFVSMAISLCGLRVGELAAKAAYALALGNEADEEFYASLFRFLTGLFMFIGMPLAFYLLRAGQAAAKASLSRLMQYGFTLTALVVVTGLLAGSEFDYRWVIFLATTAVSWVIYHEAMTWLLADPNRTLPAAGAAAIATLTAVLAPKVVHLLDIQPDWARHAMAAAMLVMLLGAIIAASVVLDPRDRGGPMWRASIGR
jgi:hypothetical protein